MFALQATSRRRTERKSSHQRRWSLTAGFGGETKYRPISLTHQPVPKAHAVNLELCGGFPRGGHAIQEKRPDENFAPGIQTTLGFTRFLELGERGLQAFTLRSQGGELFGLAFVDGG